MEDMDIYLKEEKYLKNFLFDKYGENHTQEKEKILKVVKHDFFKGSKIFIDNPSEENFAKLKQVLIRYWALSNLQDEGEEKTQRLLREREMLDVKRLLGQLELKETLDDLRKLGLNEEEVQGYIDFYYNSWLDVLGPVVAGEKKE